MTAVLDTQLLLTFSFPPNEDIREKATRLLQRELSRRVIIPSIVLTEYIKIAGRRIGLEAATSQINVLEDRGAEICEIDRTIALVAGKLLIKHPGTPVADALVAATYRSRSAEYILTGDSHIEELGCKTKWL